MTTTLRHIEIQEDGSMPPERIQRGLVLLANILGVVWLLLALGILGYFASLALQLVRPG